MSGREYGYSDMICEKVIETVVEYLHRAYKDGNDLQAREKMAVSATFGGWMLINVHAHLGHAIAHAIGGKMHVPHGLAASWVLPYAIEHVADHVPEKIRTLIEMFGAQAVETASTQELGAQVRDLLIDFRTNLGVVPKLPEDGEAHLDEVAREAVAEVHQNFAYRKMDEAQVLQTLSKAFGEGK